jgi:alkylation response protein AidB-like acyl-CoA dehydrogenase
LKYSKERKAFGKEIFNHQAIAFKLADMYVKVTAAKLLVMKAACEKMKVKILRTLVQWQNYMLQKLLLR